MLRQQGERRSAIPKSGGKQHITIHHTTNLDGKKLAKNTTKHQVSAALFPTSVGSMDKSGVWAGPGAESFA
jgi:hypothetical protein